MILAEPPRSQYDLNFSLFGVPVRVHPWFWLISALLGINADDPTTTEPVFVFLWMIAVFLSILVHEFGHVAAFRYFGAPADVVLYSFGGLAIPRRHAAGGFGAQIIISFAGPAAGFLFAGFIFACLQAAGVPFQLGFGLPEVVDFRFGFFEPVRLWQLVAMLLTANIYWGIVNLLPIFPLDGGQIARAVLLKFDVPDAIHKSLVLSMVAAGGMVLVGIQTQQIYLAVMFGYLAYMSYQAMQQNRGNFRRSPW